MEINVNLDSAYIPSDDVVAREIEGELIIVPLAAGIGDMEDELFTLNETGSAIWDLLKTQKKLRNVIEQLSEDFEAPADEIEKDVIGFVEELLKRGMLVEVAQD
ncbi:PqqD family peptide modification chaperone [Candidatus Poribacteria bacterium]|nr:PqqD family peptide modification chaperone [Candidatus Poribacteria bacterium]